jgi:NAD(P)-dependent dehydrogenase (short-subunit alcohol dehydrogenase family)
MGRLQGKVAFISGAGSGIGRCAAGLFAREGAKIAVAEISAAAGEATVAEIVAAGGEVIVVETDVTSEDSVKSAVARTVAAFGALHLLYNNAGGSTPKDGPVTTLPLDEFWRVMKLDLLGTILCSRHAIPEIAKAGGGAVLNASSIVALMGFPGRDSYTAAKGAIAALTRSMAVEFAAQKIRVNALAPSVTRTERAIRLMEADPTVKSIIEKQHLVGVGDPIDVAMAALYLLSDEARVVTGVVLPVDSGITIS